MAIRAARPDSARARAWPGPIGVVPARPYEPTVPCFFGPRASWSAQARHYGPFSGPCQPRKPGPRKRAVLTHSP